jgi:hypothetical protein
MISKASRARACSPSVCRLVYNISALVFGADVLHGAGVTVYYRSLSLSSSKLRAHLQFTIDTQECLLSSVRTKLVISPFSKKRNKKEKKKKNLFKQRVYTSTHIKEPCPLNHDRKLVEIFHSQFFQSLTESLPNTHADICERYSTRRMF